MEVFICLMGIAIPGGFVIVGLLYAIDHFMRQEDKEKEKKKAKMIARQQMARKQRWNNHKKQSRVLPRHKE